MRSWETKANRQIELSGIGGGKWKTRAIMGNRWKKIGEEGHGRHERTLGMLGIVGGWENEQEKGYNRFSQLRIQVFI